MLSKLSRFVAIATLTTLTCVIANPTSAKPVSDSKATETEVIDPVPPLSMNVLVNQAFFTHSGTFFEDSSIAGQLNLILGFRSFPMGSFPENNVASDALLVNAIVVDYFRQLKEKDPTIRTYDLPNPFDTSLKEGLDYRR